MDDLVELFVVGVDGGGEHEVVEVGVFGGELDVGAGAWHPVVVVLAFGFAGVAAVAVDDLEAAGDDLSVEVFEPVDVGVEGHRADAEGAGDASDGDGILAVILEHVERGLDDERSASLAVQALPLLGEGGVVGLGGGFLWHLCEGLDSLA